MLSLNTFGISSYNDQSTQGDILEPCFVPDIKAMIRVDMVEFDVSRDQEVEDQLPANMPFCSM